ncbi:hypothetical protein GCM10020229_27380 [Kitasatospora albolonga]|uniref:hypothetical protein n=1 Tax=Kitasatospora albolonga TaxID=68173 RepID=UPI0031EB5963
MDGGADEVEGLVSDGLAVLRALERALGRRYSDRTPVWAELGFPVVERGRYAIFPLAVVPSAGSGERAALRLAELRHGLQRACVHFYGGDDFHAELELDVGEGYGRKLVEAGAVAAGPCLWRIERFGVVLAHVVDRGRARETLALHIVPVDWVHYRPIGTGTKREASRHRRTVRERDAADVVWSWPPVGPGSEAMGAGGSPEPG